MKIFITIILTAVITWTIGTQLNIEWPRIIVVNPFPSENIEYKTFNVTPNSAPVLEPVRWTTPSLRILPKIPDTGKEVINPIEKIEREVVRLVNEVRTVRGTSALLWDDRLHNLARMNSLDMANRGEMFHSSVDSQYAENCFYGQGLTWEASDIVDCWLNSEFHRTWLLCPNLENIGVGINTKSGDMYATWTFRRTETKWPDWWYEDGGKPPAWWY